MLPRESGTRGVATLLLCTLCFRVQQAMAVKPCEHRDGVQKTHVELEFTESYGNGEIRGLPAPDEVRRLAQIVGTARQVNDTAARGADTVMLRLWDAKSENKFWNGSLFSPVQVYFQLRINSGTGWLSMKQGIDREILDIRLNDPPGVTRKPASVIFYVECVPDEPAAQARNFTVNVTIRDVNDNAPVFLPRGTNNGNYTVSVRQGTPRNTVVFRGIVARDMDESQNALTRVRVLENPFFEMTGSGSEIVLRTRIPIFYEYVGKEKIHVEVVAEDLPVDPRLALNSTVVVTVSILKEEDLPPRFIVRGCVKVEEDCVSPTYTATARETKGPLKTSPEPIRAVRQDSLDYYRIHYSIVDSEHSGSFSINRSSGQLTQLKPIGETTSLVVKATKWTDRVNFPSTGRYSFALVTVAVGWPDNCTVPARPGPGRIAADLITGVAVAILAVLVLVGVIALTMKHCKPNSQQEASDTGHHDPPRDASQEFNESNHKISEMNLEN